ncbi:MAG: 3-phosphoshikimate 1-carboxyvinyltransferase, partial [Armatimonadota bacterium]
VLVGDASLSRRPMRRIAEPLNQMGAQVEGDTLPLRIRGGKLTGIDYVSPVASAQVKSAILLAGLRAEGITSVTEPSLSRDHTERMLQALGVKITSEETADGPKVTLKKGGLFPGFEFTVPGDLSSAAFFLVAAAIVGNGELVVQGVSLNPTRTGVLDVLREVGVEVELTQGQESLGEPSGTLRLEHRSGLRPFTIGGALVPRLIDEIPILAVLATQCDGVSRITDAAELRAKESDRIEGLVAGLRTLGAQVEGTADGLIIEGPVRLQGGTVDAAGDHRMGMAFAVAGLVAQSPVIIENAESIATSFPTFENELRRLSTI